ncbi:MAG: hypothetical protein RL199_1059 [Pseudomonadota bacterium]|jgi:chromosome partitioning protein
MARILSVSNQKGGVGKTTTAVNLAASLAAADVPTLLVDLDPQGNAGSGLGFPKDADQPTVYDALVGGVPLADCLWQTSLPYLSLVPSTPDLTGAEIELVTMEEREFRLKKALEPLARKFSVILLDCSPSLGLLTLNALTAAKRVLVPLQCEYYALEGISQLMRTIDLVQSGLNTDLALEGILLTMYDARNNLARQVETEIRGHFGKKVFETVIPRNVRLSESPSHGRAVNQYDPRSTGAKAYEALAAELLKRWGKGAR